MASKVPPSLKGVGNYIKIANENVSRDPVVYYWCLYFAVQSAMQIDKKSPDALQFITSLLGTLEVVKKQLAGNDAITSDVVAQAHLEEFAWKLFKYADEREKIGQVDKAVVHAFFTAGYVFDVLSLFGEIEEGVANTKKYAKWKCMQINQCLKDGTPYVPSIQQKNEQEEDDELLRQLTSFGQPTLPQPPAANNFEHNYDTPKPPQIPGHSQVPGGPGHGFAAPPVPPAPAQRNYYAPPADNVVPHPASPSPSASSAPAGEARQLTFEEFNEARKFIKYAVSAIEFEDSKSAIDNLRKAIRVLEK